MELEPDELTRRVEGRVGAAFGKYRLERVLGVGGMAAVYAGAHRNGHKVAVKILHEELSVSQELKARFLREGYVANAVEHKGVVRVIDDDVTDQGAPFLVMELLSGMSLADHIDRAGGRLAPEEAVPIAVKLLDILSVAHDAGIVHRDIKPDNVFVTDEGDLKILDFGIARVARGASVTRTGAVMGTPAYMAPEQARGLTKLVDGQTDVWAVGAILFRALTGRHVFVGETPEMTVIFAATETPPPLKSVLPDADEALAACVDRALAPDKAARFADARAMLEALAALPAAGDVKAQLAPRPSAPQPAVRAKEPPESDRDVVGAHPKTPTWAREILESQPTMTPSVLPAAPESVGAREAPRSEGGSTRLVIGGVVGVAIAGALIAGLVVAARPDAPTREVGAAPASSAAPPPSTAEPPPTSASILAPSLAASVLAPSPAASAGTTTAPTVSGTPHEPRASAAPPRPGPAPSHAPAKPPPKPSASSVAPAPAGAGCDPPWRLNANGTREYKLECFKK